MACIESRMLFTTVASPCQTLRELLAGQVEKSFLQNEGGCRDGANYEKEYQQEDASAENKNHTSIPTSLVLYKNVWV